jgi:hypothetical protein
MKGYNKWSYAPYKPLINDGNNSYINRVVPSENAIHFEWLNIDGEKSVFYKKSDRLFQDGRLNDSRLIISYQYRVPYPRTYDRSI